MPTYRKNSSVVPAGEYQIRVLGAMSQVSKKGNEMIRLHLSAGSLAHCFHDYLVFTEECALKIAQFLTAMGEEVPDEKDVNPDDYIGRTGRALVGVKEFNRRLQNTIEKWLPPMKSTDNTTSPTTTDNQEAI